MTTSLDKFIIVIYSDKRPEYKSPSTLIGKRAREIKVILNLPKGYTIAIRTPTFIQHIDPDVVITDICKNLVREDPFDYSYALQIINKDDKNSIQLILQCEVDNILPNTTTPISMPNFIVNFNIDEYSFKSEYALNKIVSSFQLPIENPQLFINKKLVDFNQLTTLDIIKQLRFDKNENVFKCHLTEKAIQTMENRIKPMKELIETEKEFLKRMNFIIHYFYPKIMEADLVKDKGQYERFDQSCQKIFIIHSKFLTSLTNVSIEYKTSISSCFFKTGESFLVTQNFIRQYRNIESILAEIKNDSRLKEIENKVYNDNKIDYHAYVSAPFQRLAKYPLLLKAIRELTPNSHIDYRFLCIAESQMKSICSQIENFCDRIQNIPEMIKIANRIQDPDINVASNDHSLKSFYDCKIRTKDDLTKKKSGMIYLYSDRVLCTRKNGMLNKVTENVVFYKKIKNLKFVISAGQEEESILFMIDRQDYVDVIFEKDKRKDYIENFRQIRQNLMIMKPNQIFAEEVIPSSFNNISIPSICCHSAAAISDTMIFFTGGITSSEKSTCSPIITFDSKSQTFSADSQILTPSPEMKMASIQNNMHEEGLVSMYLFGGRKLNNVFLFMKDHWQELPGKSTFTRVRHSFVSYKNYLVVFGGLDEFDKESNELWIYDIMSYTWNKPFSKHKMPPPRCDHSAVIYKNTMIIHGGKLKNEKLNDTWIFSFDQNEWAKIELHKNNGIIPRSGHSAVIANQFMIVFGGEGFLNLPFALNIETLNVLDLEFKGNYILGMNHFAASTISDTKNLNNKQIICFGGMVNDFSTTINSFTRFYLPESITNPDQIRSNDNIKLEMNENHVKLLKYKSRSSVMLYSNSSELLITPIDGECFQ